MITLNREQALFLVTTLSQLRSKQILAGQLGRDIAEAESMLLHLVQEVVDRDALLQTVEPRSEALSLLISEQACEEYASAYANDSSSSREDDDAPQPNKLTDDEDDDIPQPNKLAEGDDEGADGEEAESKKISAEQRTPRGAFFKRLFSKKQSELLEEA